MPVGGGGLPVCALLSVVGPLKMLCLWWKDDLVPELASQISIYITLPPPNFSWLFCNIFFSLLGRVTCLLLLTNL